MYFRSIHVVLLASILSVNSSAQRQMERLDRGMVAIAQSDGSVYLGWRLLNTDPQNVGFNVYRQAGDSEAVKLNERPITETTDFIDRKSPKTKAVRWWVCPVIDGKEQATGGKAALPAFPDAVQYIKIPFQDKYVCNKVAIADLDGDGRYDYVIKQPKQITDPGVWHPSTDTWKVEAYLHDGTFLWRKDLGWNIEQGIWYSPMVVYDFDGDGKAEVAIKTSVTDVDYRWMIDGPLKGKVVTGPEYCSILDGMTGKELDRVDWIARGKLSDWGDEKNNRASRHLMGMAYLDGQKPSLLVMRGTYTLMRVDAYNLENKKLKKLWSWSGDDMSPVVRGQGMHGMHAADIDNDGKDEIILGSAVLDDDGKKVLWNTRLGHPDACYVTDILPYRPGLEIIYGIEPAQEKNGICLVDAKTGEIIWGRQEPTEHVHSQGVLGDFDPTHPGMEFYSREKYLQQSYTYSMDGTLLPDASVGFGSAVALYWTAEAQKLIATRKGIAHFKGEVVTPYEGYPLAVADCLGDWREELITVVEGELRIYTTTTPAKDRRVTLMQDSIYRNDAAMVSMGYLYPPQLSYYLALDAVKVK